MQPWMDEPADRGADALFTRFVCRVSGAPADTVDTLRAERTLSILRELEQTDRRLRGAREDVSQALFAAIGAAQEKPARNRLITLKRELYNLRAPSAEKIAAALEGVEAQTAGAVRAFAADLERARGLEAELRQAHDGETAELRHRFRGLLEDSDFRKGLLISSRSLYGNLDRYAAATTAGELHGRDEKTERGLLRYYTRMAMKATPFATFCAIIPGTFEDGDGAAEGETRFTSDPRAKRSFVRANKYLYGLFFDHLKTRPAVRHALAVERNPTLRDEGGRLVYLTAIEGREVFQRLGNNEVLQLIAGRLDQQAGATLGDLIRALSADPEIDATPEEAEAYLDKLIEIGFLRFHTGIREQDADWDLPFRALLDRIDDDHARQTSRLLGTLRERIEAYTGAGVREREAIIAELHALLEDALESMEVSGRLRRDMPFYEDATSTATARIARTPGVKRAFGAFERWVRSTARLAWPRPEQATMRHFYQTYYGDAQGVPLLKFYEDFYREHFKAHVEKEGRQRAGANRDELGGYDVGNPFNLDAIRDLGAARTRLTEIIRRRWEAARDAETVDLSPDEVDAALAGVETLTTVPRSMGAFGLLVPPAGEGEDPAFVLHGASYTAGYGKYFSRFLYMLPDDVQEDVRRANAALSRDMLAEICGDAGFNANLHPPLMRWEISYPTGESGATEQQLPSAEIRVVLDAEDPQSLALVHGPTGRRVIPVDLGFLNPRMRPPLYQLLSRFTPPSMYAPSIPESLDVPQQKPRGSGVEGEAAGVEPAAERAAAAEGEAPAAPAPPEPAIHYRPRITYGGRVVLTRRRWSVPSALFPQRRPDESAADFFLRANRWRAENGIPETAYLRIIPVPEARPRKPGEAQGEPAPAEDAAAEIPGYEAPVAEGEVEAEGGEDEAAEQAPAAAQDGAPVAEGAQNADAQKKRTQPSRDFFKPQFMDFGNPLLVGLLGKVAGNLKGFNAVFEERYPGRAQLARHEGTAFATELVVQLYFPGGTASAAAPAGALAGALPGE